MDQQMDRMNRESDRMRDNVADDFFGLFLSLFFHRDWPELEPLSLGLRLMLPGRRLRPVFCKAKKHRPQFDSSTEAAQAASFCPIFEAKIGQNWNRTSDTRIFSPLLYQLSYLAKGLQDSGSRTFLAMKQYRANCTTLRHAKSPF